MASKKKIEQIQLAWAFSFECPSCAESNFITSIYMEDGSSLGVIYIPDYVKCGGCKTKLETDYPPGVKSIDKKEEKEDDPPATTTDKEEK